MEQNNIKATPGVYVTEISSTPPGAVPVATAIPIFIGYTEIAPKGNSPVTITSMADFERFFGKAPVPMFSITPASAKEGCFIQNKFYSIVNSVPNYYLYNSMRLFYANGGGTCHVVSIGSYSDAVTLDAFTSALDVILQWAQGTMLVFPDALLLDREGYYTFVNSTIAHCNQLQDKVSLIDVYGGDNSQQIATPANTSIEDFRSLTITGDGLSYGVAYFPWVKTNIAGSTELTCLNFSIDELTMCLSTIPDMQTTGLLSLIQKTELEYGQADAAQKPAIMDSLMSANASLLNCSSDYANLMNYVLEMYNILPVTPAIAGVYTMVDGSDGVWMAPANKPLYNVLDTCNLLNDTTQSILNVDAITGKSICGIRNMPNMGPTVWGARTLDGNSNDWRYVNVKRTMIMIEQSIKVMLQAYVFAANDSNTWSTVQSAINLFLTGLWSSGAIVGSTPSAAFSVMVGLGTTMTGEDLLNGIMRVSVKVALAHPAEFIVITLEQQMQTS
jgi:phage tail sheath protein FI